MRERVLQVGKPVPLVGVIGQPDSVAPDSLDPGSLDKAKPAVLLLNSGVMHHVGACRLSVKLARALNEMGFLTVRFDYSGIGDSETRPGSASFEELAPKESQQVMDYIEKKFGIRQFVLFGLCSGSDAAYETALVDDRIVGIAQIDAYCYTNWKYHVNHYLSRLFKLEHWKSFMLRKLGLLKKFQDLSPHEAAGVDEEYFEVPTYTRILPPKESIANGLQQLMDRQVRVLTIFTGSEPNYNYANQFFDTFGRVIRKDLYELEYFSEASHIVSEPDSQGKVLARVCSWVNSF